MCRWRERGEEGEQNPINSAKFDQIIDPKFLFKYFKKFKKLTKKELVLRQTKFLI